MEPKIVELNIPLHIRDYLFEKPHGSAYREVLQNYNLVLIVPSHPKQPIVLKGYYPDIEYGPQELRKHVKSVLNLEYLTEILISNTFARELKSDSKLELENIEIDSNCMIEIFETNLLIHGLKQESIIQAKTELEKLVKTFNLKVHPKVKQKKEPLSDEYQFVEEFWFAKDMRRPSHNVI